MAQRFSAAMKSPIQTHGGWPPASSDCGCPFLASFARVGTTNPYACSWVLVSRFVALTHLEEAREACATRPKQAIVRKCKHMLLLTPMRTLFASCVLLLSIFVPQLNSQSSSPVTVPWPDADKPILKLAFAGFTRVGLVNGAGIYSSDVTAQNLSDQSMPRSVFTVNILDANGVKIGKARLQLDAIPPYRTAKSQVQFSAAGTPANVTLIAGKTIPLSVRSVPPGASFSVDGQDAGLAPKLYDFTIGSHTIEFHKEGYAPGSTQLDVTADELPGGSISLELGGLSQDTVELRDGTTITGDLISMTLHEAVFQSDGKVKTLDRNQIKKIYLVERVSANPSGGDKDKDMIELRDGTALFGEILSMSAKEIVLRRDGKELYIDRKLVKKIIHEEASAPPAAVGQTAGSH
ncbi:MAG TPA: PEGA domain-containing protein [Terriglobales bacterium]|nr:PEGA domain-containing protein [Terriglobales bacterium]